MRRRNTPVSHARYISLCVLLKMELAALPGDSGERFGKGLTDPLVIITGDAVRPVHAPHYKALNKGGPMFGRLWEAN